MKKTNEKNRFRKKSHISVVLYENRLDTLLHSAYSKTTMSHNPCRSHGVYREVLKRSIECATLDCVTTRLNVCHEFLPALRPRIWIMKAQTNARAHKTNKRRKRSSCILRARFCSLPEWASALDAASVISVLIRLFKILGFFSVLYCACVGTKRNRWNERKKQT